jgi:hypothetical protein
MSVFPWKRHVFSGTRQVVNRILIVADGKIAFGEDTFGLSELLEILRVTRDPWDTF